MQSEGIPSRLCVATNANKHPATGPYMLGIASGQGRYEQYWMQMRDSSKLVKKSCTSKARHDGRQSCKCKKPTCLLYTSLSRCSTRRIFPPAAERLLYLHCLFLTMITSNRSATRVFESQIYFNFSAASYGAN